MKRTPLLNMGVAMVLMGLGAACQCLFYGPGETLFQADPLTPTNSFQSDNIQVKSPHSCKIHLNTNYQSCVIV